MADDGFLYIFGPALQYKLTLPFIYVFSQLSLCARGLSALFDANCKLLCIVTSWRKRHCRLYAIFHFTARLALLYLSNVVVCGRLI
jgi:hypothetical protein